MKIRRWLIISYILVILAIIGTGFGLYSGIKLYNKNTQIDNYLKTMDIIHNYEKLLEDKSLYDYKNEDFSKLKDIDEDKAIISTYNNHGYRIYTNDRSGMKNYMRNSEFIYSDLYRLNESYNKTSIKKPVFDNEKLIGIYEIQIMHKDVVDNINNMTRLAIISFVFIIILIIYIVNRFLDRKLNRPMESLIYSMEEFGKGNNIELEYESRDEIGQMISGFNNMKEQIIKSDRELREQEKSKEYMISAISHDLKTPLMAIRAYTELGIENDKDYSDIIIDKCDDMSIILDDLFTYSILSSDYDIELVEVEGAEFFEMLLSGYEELFKEKDLEYKSIVDVDGNYMVSPKEMIRLMDNLISNSIRYSKKNGNIFVSAISTNKKISYKINKKYRKELEKINKDGVLIMIQNQGIPISKKEQKNIFKPFYKIDDSRNLKDEGTGLGLSIVKNIIDRHNGKIKIYSSDKTDILITCYIDRI